MYIHKHGNETAQTVIILHPMGIDGFRIPMSNSHRATPIINRAKFDKIRAYASVRSPLYMLFMLLMLCS